jgi:hypothetical protein
VVVARDPAGVPRCGGESGHAGEPVGGLEDGKASAGGAEKFGGEDLFPEVLGRDGGCWDFAASTAANTSAPLERLSSKARSSAGKYSSSCACSRFIARTRSADLSARLAVRIRTDLRRYSTYQRFVRL